MTRKLSLGELRLLDLRSMWPHEAADFTPWLALPENIQKLGAEIGIELEVENTEVQVGPFAADIVAKDTSNDSYVVIENQLGKTNHDHLGKALTYAAALGARTIVWVAPEFTDEHKKALDWLNDHTLDEIGFFAVQPELWQIDESAPALRFNVLSRPTEGRIVGPGNPPMSEVRRLQFEWWTAFRERLLATKQIPSAGSPRPQTWFPVTLGRTGFHISNSANTFENRISVRLYLSSRFRGEDALRKLTLEREAIEREIGTALQWDANPTARDKSVSVQLDADLRRKDKWPDYLTWMVDMTVRFRKAFGPRLGSMDLDEPSDDSGAEA